MKKITLSCLLMSFAVLMFCGCNGNTRKNTKQHAGPATTQAIADSTIYGVCGDGTAMHTLQLISDAGDSLDFELADNPDGPNPVLGGLLVGDRLAVVAGGTMDGMRVARKVINLTTLLGKWTSLDKNFEILEGGVVKSHVEAEKNPWTSWKIINGKLLLGTDTFDIDGLGADSLYLENHQGIFVYTRQK